MKNDLMALNNFLFSSLENLDNPELKGEDLEEALIKAKAKVQVAGKIIDNAGLMLEAAKLQKDFGGDKTEVPSLLIGDSDDR